MRFHPLAACSLLSLAWCVVASPVAAQPALERLERQIRQRIAATDSGQSGYLGLVADDQKDRGRGVRILEVHPNSPAAKAGLRKQDLITTFADVRIRQMTDFADVLATLPPEKTAEVELLRGNQTLKLKVTMGQRPAAINQQNQPNQPEAVPLPPGEAIIPDPPEPETGPDLALPKIVPPSRSDESRVEELQRRVNALETRVAELERQLAEVLNKNKSS